MTPTPPTTRVEPPIARWSLGDGPAHDRLQLVDRINARAKRLGTPALQPPVGRLIATGHQARLWHPGILAKDVAVDLVADRLDAQRLHVVVDHDTHDAWRLDVPYVESDTIKLHKTTLAPQAAGVPAGYQPPADHDTLKKNLDALGSPMTRPLADAIENLPACESCAEQIAVVLTRLKKPYAGDVPVMFVSDLAGLDVFQSLVNRMLHDAARCAALYNRAVARFPEARVAPLAVSRELIELPLWTARRNEPRRRVFVDLADSQPLFVHETGEPIDRTRDTLLPRALTLTAVMRSALCDLFVHGTGGRVYDRITEAWWRDWAGRTLAPMAAVTADLYLDFHAPLADRDQLDRAVWRRHHLPHNVDRELKLAGPDPQRKAELLAHMDDDRDRARRRKAFNEIHRINDRLCREHADLIADADDQVRRARLGIENARIARRRDFFFGLYPHDSLRALRRALAGDGL